MYMKDYLNPDAAEEMLLDKSYDGFVRSGALLNDADKDKLRKLYRRGKYDVAAIFTKLA